LFETAGCFALPVSLLRLKAGLNVGLAALTATSKRELPPSKITSTKVRVDNLSILPGLNCGLIFMVLIWTLHASHI